MNRAKTVALFSAFALSACNQTSGPAEALALTSTQKPSALITTVARTAQTCWFKSKDKAFTGYRLAAEVNSYAGRPRFLIVPKSNPGGLPVLVVQAESKGGATRVEAYGPLLKTDSGSRIAADVKRWANGGSGCKATA